ncbi:MAG: hypothetical protein PHW18_11670 [Sulfuricurvum sp.]|uniref:hypothetical protein n=1 Tax=Sulfuricurvum sp. TaxID=2025608 RepID=UPI00261EFF7C|nr:hypothetical protein [Sulfuricurvum sp.]MDD2830222.1 hypothetical protein [Sulfuricurvum sp.]MDD4950008.1 hypothetical protein [Sulfuricurvum sp.]
MQKSLILKKYDAPYSYEIIRDGLLVGTLAGILEGIIIYILTDLSGGFDIVKIY